MLNSKKVLIPKSNRLCKIKNIVFFGGADCDKHDPTYKEAFAAAKYAASKGKIIINGGGPGVMQAASEGAKAAGGKTLVVTFYPQDLPEFEGRAVQNIADQEIKTANYIDRMFKLMDVADLFICFKGGTGTLSEWATAWLLAHLYYGNHKPLILYGAFWHEFMDMVDKNFVIGYKESQVYRIVNDLSEFKVALRIFEEEMAARRLKLT
ncbi:MAG TPA: LOG family protein [Candidatus Woesebacteria bacterium]|nr:LOG family protein [Candidatus Woesebacteria bacterium]